MTNQMQGEILYAGLAGTDAGAVYTPWMPVRGDNGTFGVEVMQVNRVTLTWSVQTRTRESDTVTAMMADQTTASLGVDTAESTTDAKELVRYKFSTGTSANTGEFVVLRALQPSWQVDR